MASAMFGTKKIASIPTAVKMVASLVLFTPALL
jgi:hypothetical protein